MFHFSISLNVYNKHLIYCFIYWILIMNVQGLYLFVNPLQELKLHLQVFQSPFQGNSGRRCSIHILRNKAILDFVNSRTHSQLSTC